jgi:hypothetical protein
MNLRSLVTLDKHMAVTIFLLCNAFNSGSTTVPTERNLFEKYYLRFAVFFYNESLVDSVPQNSSQIRGV